MQLMQSDLRSLPTATDVSCPPVPEGFESVAAVADEAMRLVLYVDTFDGLDINAFGEAVMV